MRTSQAGVNAIKQHEALRLNSYRDPVGIWTIGYGHTGEMPGGDPVRAGLTITTTQATQLLASDLRRFEEAVTKGVKKPLTQNQFDALVSFAFNVGVGNFNSSKLLRELNKGNYNAVPVELMRWTKAGNPKRELPGLVNRRRAEARMWRGLENNRVTAGREAGQVSPTPPADQPSITAPVGTAVGGGLVALIEAFPALRNALKTALDSVGIGDALPVIIGAMLVAGGAWYLFKRYRDSRA